MDFDFKIINEEGDCPNQLFESIMTAMNSMKEATADKIYQKIQKDGETNYSKPQVDKALANALKYGIFEVRNNRYRVKDDILDDETVFWKFQEKREQTPFRIQDGISEKQFGLKLDPERDNQRFKKIGNADMQECPHCGRTKRLGKRKTKKRGPVKKKLEKTHRALRNKRNHKKVSAKNAEISKRKHASNRKSWVGQERSMKKKKPNRKTEAKICTTSDTFLEDFWTERNDLQEKGSLDSATSNLSLLKAPHHTLESTRQEEEVKVNKQKNRTQYLPENEKRSGISIRTDPESMPSSINFVKDHQSHSKTWDSFLGSFPCTSRDGNSKTRNQYLRSSEVYHNEYDNNQTDQHTGKADWLGYSDEPQGAIIQTNNVLTIEPMDSLAFKSPEQASYIS